MTWRPVAKTQDIEPGQATIVDVAGREIGIFSTPQGYVAVLNFCPHAGAPICRGRVTGRTTCDDQGRVGYDPHALTLRCPWHHWEFDLASGKAVTPIPQRLKLYDVKVEAGQIFVRV